MVEDYKPRFMSFPFLKFFWPLFRKLFFSLWSLELVSALGPGLWVQVRPMIANLSLDSPEHFISDSRVFGRSVAVASFLGASEVSKGSGTRRVQRTSRPLSPWRSRPPTPRRRRQSMTSHALTKSLLLMVVALWFVPALMLLSAHAPVVVQRELPEVQALAAGRGGLSALSD